MNTEIESAGAPGKPARPVNLPEKFWDDTRGEIRIDALVQSYAELERKLSASMPRPVPGSADEESLYRALGWPESADQYRVDTSHGLFAVDPDLNSKLFEARFTPRQVQVVYDMAAEKLVPMLLEMAADFQADREVERLIAEFGGAEGWRDMSRQLLAFAQKNLPPEMIKGLASSYDGIMALYAMMKNKTPALPSSVGDTSVDEENQIRALMRDPKYWRDRDPVTIARVTQGFERLYK